MRRALALTLPALLAVLVVIPFWATRAGEDPLTEEDVVRMFVSGVSVDEMVERIETSQTAFALDEDMLDELRNAGLAEVVIEAMVARQRELDPEPEPEVTEEPELTALPVLRVRIDHDEPRLSVPAGIPAQMREQLRLRAEVERYTDVAIFLACLTPDHVPDHWRTKSPLGRDFISVPRHRILTFRAGSTGGTEGAPVLPAEPADTPQESGGDAMVSLEFPETLTVDLDPGVAHDLMLGVALLAGDRWYRAQSAVHEGAILDDDGLDLAAHIRASKKPGSDLLQIRFLEP